MWAWMALSAAVGYCVWAWAAVIEDLRNGDYEGDSDDRMD